MANTTGTLPEGNTHLSSIKFYAGVLLDPKEEKWYVKLPPANFDKANGKISDYWTRKEFEDEVLVPHEVKTLAIPESMFQNPGKQIYHPSPLSDFVLTNVNFVKVTNTDGNGSKIFYGFISSVTYDNDGNTIVDWAVSEFYTNLFNGITFNYAQISKAHNRLSNTKGEIIDEVQYRVKENLSAGDTLIPQENFDILPDVNKYIRFWVCELYISKDNPTKGITSIDIGYPSSRAYIVIPIDHNHHGVTLDMIDDKGNKVGGPFAGKSLGEVLMDLSVDQSWQAKGVTIGQMGITYSLGGNYTLDDVNSPKTLTFKDGDLLFGTLPSKNYELPVLYSTSIAKPFIKTFTDGLYTILMQQIILSEGGQELQLFFNARGGVPEKLTHYVGMNFLDGDALIGSFTGDEVAGGINDPIVVNTYSSPHQFSRLDILVEPYVNKNSLSSNQSLIRKFVNQRNSSIPFADNAWSTYSYLNQNQMQNAKNVINTTQDITRSQNQFNNNQAHTSAQQARDRTQLGNTQSMAMTTQTANQQNGMAQIAAGFEVGGSAIGGVVSGYRSGGVLGAVGGLGGGAAAGAMNAAQGLVQADRAMYNANMNQGLQNRQNTAMTGLQTSQQLALADNTLNFGNKIAAQTAEMKRASLQAGWNDMKLAPATVVSGGSETEYLAHMFWDFPTAVFSIPTMAVLMTVGRHLMEFGNECNIYDKIQKYFFTRKVVNFIRTDDCSISPSSNIENSVRIQLETAFNRGVQIWHDLKKMADMNYEGNDYV